MYKCVYILYKHNIFLLQLFL